MNLSSRIATTLVMALAAGPLFAATSTPTAKSLSPQQQRMAQCSAQNKGKHGADYQTAQKACLSGKAVAASASASSPQQRMAKCAEQNKGKKGAEYKAAQSACLKTH